MDQGLLTKWVVYITVRLMLTDSMNRNSIEQSIETFAMSRATFILLVVIGVFLSTTAAQHQCPENQEWTTCGSACPPSCNSDPHRPCTMQCVVGCQCKEGLLLSNRGDCVSPTQC
ncbi:cysteine-rich venom protein 6-like [Polyergus mexicanus]|uniref:cysteine-rich venom protein 6-like n=1 Tax=Polyergus mexicanus TaxID=615972 RepID=UPI0038B66132